MSIGAALVVLALVAVPQGPDWQKLAGEARFSLVDAIERARKEAGSGVPFHAELEQDKGKLVYSIDLAQGDKTCNVVLDCKTGKVLENVVEDEDHSAAVGACKVALPEAVAAALAQRKGVAIEAQLTLAAGRPVITVKVFAGGELVPLRVDGASGRLLQDPVDARAAVDEAEFTDRFGVAPGELASSGRNPFFVLEPGYVLVLEGKDGRKSVRLTVTVLNETRTVDGVETRIVEEREEADGELVEVSRNFFAISKRTNDVYYFGEEVDEYEDGKVAGHPGAWLSGKDGARFGLMLPGTPLLGARYQQETAPGVAMDRAEIVSLSASLDTPAGRLTDCLEVRETTPLEPDVSRKVYARGIGMVADATLRLVRHGK